MKVWIKTPPPSLCAQHLNHVCIGSSGSEMGLIFYGAVALVTIEGQIKVDVWIQTLAHSKFYVFWWRAATNDSIDQHYSDQELSLFWPRHSPSRNSADKVHEFQDCCSGSGVALLTSLVSPSDKYFNAQFTAQL
jgi:hypothetical protein